MYKVTMYLTDGNKFSELRNTEEEALVCARYFLTKDSNGPDK